MTTLGPLRRKLLRGGGQPLLRPRPVGAALGRPAGALLPLELASAPLEIGTQPAHFAVDAPIARLDGGVPAGHAALDARAVLLLRPVPLRRRLALCGVPELGLVVHGAGRRAGEVEGVGAGAACGLGVLRLPGDLGLGVRCEGALARRGAGRVGLGGEFWDGVVPDLDAWLVLCDGAGR